MIEAYIDLNPLDFQIHTMPRLMKDYSSLEHFHNHKKQMLLVYKEVTERWNHLHMNISVLTMIWPKY